MSKLSRILLASIGAMSVSGWFGTAGAQDYPRKAIDLIVPYVPGGTTDLSARVLAKDLNERWKVPVRVVNKPGGNTVPGVSDLMRAQPDGYTLLIDGPGSSSLIEIVAKDLPFAITDRTFVGLFTQAPTVFFVKSDAPYATIGDLVAKVKTEPDSFTWTSSIGPSEVALWQFFHAAGVDWTKTRPVKLRGGAENATAVASGQVLLGSGAPASAAAAIASGRVKLIANAAATRSPAIPDVPTTTEQGYPGIQMVQWHGISGPPNLAPAAIAAWTEALNSLVKSPTFAAELAKISMQPFQADGADGMRKYIVNQRDVVRKLVLEGK